MTGWRKEVEEYVELRRSLGFKLLDAKNGLIKFASLLEQSRADPHYDCSGDEMGAAGQECAPRFRAEAERSFSRPMTVRLASTDVGLT